MQQNIETPTIAMRANDVPEAELSRYGKTDQEDDLAPSTGLGVSAVLGAMSWLMLFNLVPW